MKKIPKQFPAVMWDRFVSLQDYCMGELMIQLEMKFQKKIDTKRLERAIELTIESQPVLGCRFVHHWLRPYWEKADYCQDEVLLLTENKEEYELFKSTPIDTRKGPQIKACLWASSAGTCLLLKVSHVAADAGGVKEIAAYISSIYSKLAVNPDYRPPINLKGSRNFFQILKNVPFVAYPKILAKFIGETFSNQKYHACHTLSLGNSWDRSPVYVLRFLQKDRVQQIVEYGHEHNATLNDLTMTALLRALAFSTDWDGQTQLKLGYTVDLRRYLPTNQAEGICNLSCWEYFSLGSEPGDNFNSTLAQVVTLSQKRKANWLGLSDSTFLIPILFSLPYGLLKIGAPAAFERSNDTRKQANVLTNMGAINPSEVTFDEQPKNAWLLVPPIYPPTFVVGLSGYRGNLTLSAGVYPAQQHIVEQFFDSIMAELPG